MTSPPETTLTCRHIRYSEVGVAFDLVARMSGWNLTREKFTLLCKQQPGHFYVAVTGDGEVVATLSYAQTFADEYILGNLVVKEECRGKGVGSRVLRDTLAMFKHKVVQLTAVPGVDQFYIKNGFSPCEPGHLIRYLTPRHDVITGRASSCDVTASVHPVAGFVELDDLIQFDMKLRGYDNTDFLSAVAHCACVLAATEQTTGRIMGYVVAFRKSESLLVLDGLYAESDDVAVQLFRDVIKQFPGVTQLKLQLFSSNQFLLQFGDVTVSEEYQRFCLGGVTPTRVREGNVYCVTDSDYTM